MFSRLQSMRGTERDNSEGVHPHAVLPCERQGDLDGLTIVVHIKKSRNKERIDLYDEL